MAKISWSVGDFFVCKDSMERVWGVVTSVEKGKCVIVADNGLRTGRFTIASALIPDDAMPATLRNADFEVKMALYGAIAGMGELKRVRVI